jgi:hypothetical protein
MKHQQNHLIYYFQQEHNHITLAKNEINRLDIFSHWQTSPIRQCTPIISD